MLYQVHTYTYLLYLDSFTKIIVDLLILIIIIIVIIHHSHYI